MINNDNNAEEKNKSSRLTKIILLWFVLVLIIVLAYIFKLNKKIFTSIIILYGLVTPIFTGIIATLSVWIAAIPWIGPLLIKIISLPMYWLLNGIASLWSIIFVAKGESKKAVDARILTIVFFVGFLLGYVLGKIF
ncbi:MAG: hypothetical protein HY934_02260 [Candidatus Firestonebacteria bacterium]|nr:hypothetical protein [Candidatus Firestonebacteria bacterium]